MTTYEIPVKSVKEGCTVIVDDAFTCIPPYSERTVKCDNDGEFFVDCSHGRHYLSGQFNFETQDTYVGLTLGKGEMG